MFGSDCRFSVQVAHAMGAAEYDRARDIMRQGILISFYSEC